MGLTPEQVAEVDSLAVVYEQKLGPVHAERLKLAAELAARLQGQQAAGGAAAASSLGEAIEVRVTLSG